MTARYLLDTNVCIYIQQRRPEAALRRFATLSPGEAVLSVITYGELVYGVEKSASVARNRGTLRELVALMPVLSLPTNAGEAYGRVRASLAREGNLIGPNDLWIAAHALASDLTLVTNNEREFGRIEGLSMENWAK